MICYAKFIYRKGREMLVYDATWSKGRTSFWGYVFAENEDHAKELVEERELKGAVGASVLIRRVIGEVPEATEGAVAVRTSQGIIA